MGDYGSKNPVFNLRRCSEKTPTLIDPEVLDHHRRVLFRRTVFDGGGVDFGRGGRHVYFVGGAGQGRCCVRQWRRGAALALSPPFYRFRRARQRETAPRVKK